MQVFSTRDNLRACFNKKSQKIVGLIPSDFDGDAMMDVIVVSRHDGSDNFVLYFLKGKKTEIATNLNIDPVGIVLNQPLLLDYNGDMISDLLAASADDGKYYIWKGSNTSALIEKVPFGASHLDILSKPQNPSSNAFIDLNGDGLADIFIDGNLSH
jgi:integrin alpha FG-GAP repeat containing protein 1